MKERKRERIARERKTERTKDHLEIYTLKFIKSVKNVCFLTTAFPRLVQDLQINPHVTNYPFMSRSISGGGSRGRSQAIYFLAKQLKGKDAYWAHHQALENGGSFHFKFPLKQLSFFKISIPDQDFFLIELY